MRKLERYEMKGCERGWFVTREFNVRGEVAEELEGEGGLRDDGLRGQGLEEA